jgi:hypothetical protein
MRARRHYLHWVFEAKKGHERRVKFHRVGVMLI